MPRFYWVYSLCCVLFLLFKEGGSVTLSPKQENLGGAEIIWQKSTAPTDSPAVLAVFHGCNHDGIDWFTYPEERIIVKYALSKGYHVISFSSQLRVGPRCWETYWPWEENNDVQAVTSALRIWLDREHLTHLPRFALGVSSGGFFVSLLMHSLSFKGVCMMISSGLEKAILSEDLQIELPPLVYYHMVRDVYLSKRIEVTIKLLKTQSPSLSVKEIRIDPHPLTPTYFSDKMPEDISPSLSRKMFELAKKNGHLIAEDDHLKYDPREEVFLQAFASAPDSEIATIVNKRMDEIAEILNVLYATHETTAEKIETLFNFFEKYRE